MRETHVEINHDTGTTTIHWDAIDPVIPPGECPCCGGENAPPTGWTVVISPIGPCAGMGGTVTVTPVED